MIVVGELINASRKAMGAAIKARDTGLIQKTAEDQYRAGADFIDINAGIFVNEEADYLQWLVTTVQEAVDAPCCIDSPSPKAIEAALQVHKGRGAGSAIFYSRRCERRYRCKLSGRFSHDSHKVGIRDLLPHQQKVL
jgi:cobalamin-dependent methionine synthase I